MEGGSQLLGRGAEQAEIDRLVEQARSGLSGVLVLRGEPGIGKTALLDAAVSSATDFEIVRLVGIESEMRLGFAALHQLLTPFLDRIDGLPSPQARALQAAFGMSDDDAPDQFLIGLAALTLLAAAATHQPLLVVVDDTQWLDQDSADALGFVARRLHADPVCLLVAMRDTFDDRAFDGLPVLRLDPLSDSSSVTLLEATVEAPLVEHVRARVLADARGNPLALVEFGRELSPDQLAGTAHLPEPLAVDRRLEEHFLRQIGALPDPTQLLLLVAAAEPTGDPTLIWRAGRSLDIDEHAIVPAQQAGLLELGPHVAFRHPLIRSAVYQGATPAERCRAHEALAVASDAELDPDRRAWHRAAAAPFPDEEVAAELEAAAQRSGSRGGLTASAALLARAAELTPDKGARATRFLLAAATDLTAGSSARAAANLARAVPDLDDPLLAARSRQLGAAIAFFDSAPGAQPRPGAYEGDGEIVSMMLDAARALEPLDIQLARSAVFDTIPMAFWFGESSAVSVVEVAQLALSFALPPEVTPTSVDLLLDALALLLAEGYRTAVPVLRDALATVRHADDIPVRACHLAFAVSDDEAVRTLATAVVTRSREQGAFRVLPEALDYLGLCELRIGSLDVAEDIFSEVIAIHTGLRRQSGTSEASKLIVSAWRGLEPEVREKAAALSGTAPELGLVDRWAAHALIVLELGLGNYPAASALAREDWTLDLALAALRAADSVEAHVRSGDRAAARKAWEHVADRGTGTQSPLDLGLLARCDALLAEDGEAEAHFTDSIDHLEVSGARLHLARTRLLYGEWLRRQKRRRDARVQLESALEAFESTGANNFAERARVELVATGATARKRVDETRHDLTPQESQIARLAAGGLTNPEIAARLFISASTVDYHLRKVFRKLHIKSRYELIGLIPDP
jgi:DNA-binding CsgD family transcriptional regulator